MTQPTYTLVHYKQCSQLAGNIIVKNGFFNLIKEQMGQDRPKKGVVNKHQIKALREGCRERK